MQEVHDKTILVALESLLTLKFRPTYFELTIDEWSGIIQGVIVSNQFNLQNLNERVISVFGEIQKNMPTVMEEHLIIMQAFNSVEFEKVIEQYYKSF